MSTPSPTQRIADPTRNHSRCRASRWVTCRRHERAADAIPAARSEDA
jgi:hypothetical protein